MTWYYVQAASAYGASVRRLGLGRDEETGPKTKTKQTKSDKTRSVHPVALAAPQTGAQLVRGCGHETPGLEVPLLWLDVICRGRRYAARHPPATLAHAERLGMAALVDVKESGSVRADNWRDLGAR